MLRLRNATLQIVQRYRFGLRLQTAELREDSIHNKRTISLNTPPPLLPGRNLKVFRPRVKHGSPSLKVAGKVGAKEGEIPFSKDLPCWTPSPWLLGFLSDADQIQTNVDIRESAKKLNKTHT